MLGERLYDLRKEAGLTQDALSAALHINKHSVSSYERNKSEPPDSVKIQLADFFHVSVDYLLGITNDPTPTHPSQQYLRLPEGLSERDRTEIKQFAEYLRYKKRKHLVRK